MFPSEIASLMALGPKFSLSTLPSTIRYDRLLADVEFLLSDIDITERDVLRSDVVYHITSYFRNKKIRNQKQNDNVIKLTQTFLKDHKDIIISRTDKTNSTVCMYRADYNNKMLELLSDNEVYGILKSDPTAAYERKTNQLLKNLKDQKYIDDATYKRLTIHNSAPPRIYGLVKTHKVGYPLRPIVSCVQSHTKNIAKYLSHILDVSFSPINNYRVRDTFDFANQINNTTIDSQYIVVSYDVVSLFTNIPTDLALSIISDNWDLIKDNTTIPKTKFLDLLKWIFNSVYFIYDSNIYSQSQVHLWGRLSPHCC